MDAVIGVIVAVSCAALNRIRGAKDSVPGLRSLPGRALWYVTPVFGLLAWTIQPWPVALLLSASYLWFGSLPIGRWYTLGRLPRSMSGGPDRFERAVERVAGENDLIALLIRQVLASLPLMVTAPWAALIVPLLAVGSYALPWAIWDRWKYDNPNASAELLVGALWGGIIVLA